MRTLSRLFPAGGTIRRYSFDELFAEKIRAMAQRGRPRDLYDIISLFRRSDLRMYPDAIRSALTEKCAAKSIAVPTAADFVGSPLLIELESEWSNCWASAPGVASFAPFLGELPMLFAWLDGQVSEVAASVIAYGDDEDESWSPPPSVSTWRVGVPLETVRFAAANHLLVELAYDGRTRLIEPYSLRRTRTGDLILHAERADGSGHRTYRVERIQALRTTTMPFLPRFPHRVLRARTSARSAAAEDPRPPREPDIALVVDHIPLRVHPLRPPVRPHDTELLTPPAQRSIRQSLRWPFRPLHRNEALTRLLFPSDRASGE